MPKSEVESALDAFVGGFSFTRSFTHPYLSDVVDGLRVVRDGPRRRPPHRREEWVVDDRPAVEVDAVVRRRAQGRFVVCAVVPLGGSVDACRDQYKAIGYRLGATEPLMVHDLKRVPRVESPATIERVLTTESADLLNRAAGSRQILPSHLTGDAPMRQYLATVEGKPVGWVRSIVVGEATWCSNMYVAPSHRRRGIAQSLLSRMLRDDRKYGAKRAVLLASHAGAKLYVTVGYRPIGTLLALNPVK